MNPTSIENTPRIYELPTLLVKPQKSNIEKREATIIPNNVQFYIQYDFDNNLNNSQPSEYSLTSSGTISYDTNPKSVYLDGNSYLSREIYFNIKTLSFWFNSKDITKDTYLISIADNFNIQVYEDKLQIKNNDLIKNINHSFNNDYWYYLALVYNDQDYYDIYINKNKNNTLININNFIIVPTTLNIGKKNNVFNNNINNINFEILDFHSDSISARRYHTMVAIGTDIYIFGGSTGSGYLDDFYKIDTSTYSVEEITITGTTSVRHNHSMVAIGNYIYIVGAHDDNYNLNDYYKIDTSTNIGTVIDITGTSISKRHNHSMVAIGSNIYIFGGRNTTGVALNDFYKIDTSTNIVTVFDITGTSITGRYSHSMIAIEGNIYIFGGYNGSDYLDDFYKIDTSTNVVTVIDITGTSITARYDHSMVAIEGNIYIFGGYGNGGFLNDLIKITGDYSYFNGNIADLRLYNYSITSQEITTIYNNFNETVGTYIHYDFDNNLNNSQSSEYSLTSSGTTRYDTPPKSVYLDGNYYLSRIINFDLKTLSFWFKLENVNTDNYLLSTTDNNFYIQVNSNELSIKVNTDIKNITTDFIADNWYHLALTYNEQGYDIYSNNSILTEKIDNLITNSITLNIGKESGVSAYFTGNIADLRLYSYSITTEQITTIYYNFYNILPSSYTITFSETTRGNIMMLKNVPSDTIILNIVIDSGAILYNEDYEKGSGLYINFTELNLNTVTKVNITNNGTIYGRGGLGQIDKNDDSSIIGRHAIKVLSDDDDSIRRTINIINNGEILGGDNGGEFKERESYDYRVYYKYTLNIGSEHISESYNDYLFNEINNTFVINLPGTNASFFNGTEIQEYDNESVTSNVIYQLQASNNVVKRGGVTYTNANVTHKLTIGEETHESTTEVQEFDVIKTAYASAGQNHPGFDENKDIEVPNEFIIVNRIP